jgi:hypothetical protein
MNKNAGRKVEISNEKPRMANPFHWLKIIIIVIIVNYGANANTTQVII